MGRPFRVVLANLCEKAWGYGPGSSEYLRAQLLAAPDLADRIEVSILFLVGLTPAQAADRILAVDPDLVGFTAFSWNLTDSGETCRELRRRGAGVPIIWGGCSFSLFYERSDWFRWWDCVDAVAVGSGEYTIADTVRHLLEQPRSGRLSHALRGLVVNRDGRLEVGPKARTPTSLDEIASPYLMGVVYRVPNPFLEMARGCRFQCTFCSDARASREGMFRVYSVDRIAEEVRTVVAWPEIQVIDAGSSTANITDDAFVDVCEALHRGDPARRAAYTFQMYPALSRPIQRQALEGLRIHKLHFGVQSTTPDTWGPIKRKTTLDHMARAMSVFGGVDGVLQASMLLPIPGETLESFKVSFNELRQMGWFVFVNRLLALPGTQLHRDHERFGIRFDPDTYRVRATNTMSEDDMARAQDFVREAVFSLSEAEKARLTSPVMYSNFDHQRTPFASMELDDQPVPAGTVPGTRAGTWLTLEPAVRDRRYYAMVDGIGVYYSAVDGVEQAAVTGLMQAIVAALRGAQVAGDVDRAVSAARGAVARCPGWTVAAAPERAARAPDAAHRLRLER